MGLIVKTAADERTTPVLRCESADRMVDWLKLIARGPVVEMRAIRVGRVGTDAKHTECSLYPNTAEGLRSLAGDARKISPRAEGVYITLNELRPDLVKASATAADVVNRRWLLIDADPSRPKGESSTEAEKQASWLVAQTVRDYLTSIGWPAPVVADSGNGYHLLYQIFLPADDGGLVERVLKALSARFSDESVKIDSIVHDPSRVCKLYGTLARKGESTADRPHRLSYVLEAYHPMEVVAADLLEAVAAWDAGPVKKVEKPKTKRRGLLVRDLGPDPIEAHAVKALHDEAGLVAVAANGTRNHQLFKSAAALSELVNAGTLDASAVESRLRDAARSTGLDDAEINQTLRSAVKKTDGKARDLSHVGKGKGKGKAGRPATATILDPITNLKEPIDNEQRLARIYLRSRRKHADGPTIRFWNDEWHAWRDGAWRRMSDKEMSADVTRVVLKEFERHALAADEPVKGVGTRLVGNVLNVLRSNVATLLSDVPEQPSWIDFDGPSPTECLNCSNGIIHLPTLIEQGPEAALIPPTPRYFAANVLGCDFRPDAPEPTVFLKTLSSIWPDDPDSILCLQQWAGYLLTPDTSQQKIMLMVGPSRAGKGTIVHVLQHLVGRANSTAPTLSKLGSQFGSQAFIGKSAAFCGESRLAGRSDSQAIVERLLSISGEDPQSIERKNAQDWEGKLTTRFTMSANELPSLGDYSRAIINRLLILKFNQSFVGREDVDLRKKLEAELPGILVWAIGGWEFLKEAGRFVQPESGQVKLKEYDALNNPFGVFLAECCEVGPDRFAKKSDLFKAWQNWCKENGRDHPGSKQRFGSSLTTALEGLGIAITDDRVRIDGGGQPHVWKGIGLRIDLAPY